MIGHEFGTGGAIQAERKQFDVIERRPERFDALAGEHRAHGFDRCGNHQRDGRADFAAEILNRENAGFDVARVLAGFEKKKIGAAFDEAAGLLEIIFVKLRKCHAAGDADGLRRRPHRACHEARL